MNILVRKMEPTSYYILLILLPFLYFMINKFAKRFQNLPPIPPQCLPIIGHLHLMKKPHIYARLAEKYGPILMLYFGFRPILLVSSPSLVEECLVKNDLVFANRPKFLAGKLLGYDYTALVWASYGPHWRNLRKIATVEILSGSRVQKFASIRAREVHSLLLRLSRAPVVEMKAAFFELTLDAMMTMIAGKRCYGGGDELKAEEATRFREMIKEANLKVAPFNVVDYLPFARWLGFQIKVGRFMKRLQARRDRFLQGLIDERRRRFDGDEDKGNTMIDILLSLQRDKPLYYTDQIIKGMIQTMLVGGSETTALVMEWAFALLLNHPNVLNRAHSEIQNHMAKSNRLIQDSDLSHLPYIEAIIDETLRLYAVSSVIGQHEASEGCVIGGYNIPRGTILFLNTREMHRNPEIWEQPDEFRPERFLGVQKEEMKFEYMPFGLGRRRCPAEGFGRQFIALALSSLIHCFEWDRVGEDMVDMSESPGLNLARSQPLPAKCRPRPEIAKLLQSPRVLVEGD